MQKQLSEKQKHPLDLIVDHKSNLPQSVFQATLCRQQLQLSIISETPQQSGTTDPRAKARPNDCYFRKCYDERAPFVGEGSSLILLTTLTHQRALILTEIFL